LTKSFSLVSSPILVGSYGPARYEKGSDLMIAAIDSFLSKTDRQDIHFAVQWIDDFSAPDGQQIIIPDRLLLDPRFVLIDHFFAPGEYVHWLRRTSLMLLPYRDDYALRGSRVVLEAIVHGIPVLVSRGTTLEEHLNGFGVGMSFDCRNPDALCDSLIHIVSNLQTLSASAVDKARDARVHFSVANFRGLLGG
jgi:glycosyltransferase involved in cell wall biosynthesis